jgi:hypothetical protein
MNDLKSEQGRKTYPVCSLPATFRQGLRIKFKLMGMKKAAGCPAAFVIRLVKRQLTT